jgi:microcin C transport system substrate-binding protein
VYDSPQAERKNLKQAIDLFAQAGWVIKNGKMVNAKTGEPFKFEILGWNDTDQVICSPYIANLRKIGVDATLRIIDQTQYVNRLNNFDFDVTTSLFQQSDSAGNEQRDFWTSKAADKPGSRNLMGIKDPTVDALVDRVIFATDRDDLVAATHALDRVLLWNYYVVPQYYRAVIWLAYWNKFSMPEKQPSYRGADIDSWWIDLDKEKALAAKYRGN